MGNVIAARKARMRSTTVARGYGGTHQRTRASWEPIVATGRVTCPRCGELIRPGSPWDLGHSDDRTRYSGPEHAACNRGATARFRLRRTSRRW
jgi:hypothetical protein